MIWRGCLCLTGRDAFKTVDAATQALPDRQAALMPGAGDYLANLHFRHGECCLPELVKP